MEVKTNMKLDSTNVSSTNYETLVDYQLPNNCMGTLYLDLSIIPSDNQRFLIKIGRFFMVQDLQLIATWNMQLPKIEFGFLFGFIKVPKLYDLKGGDRILIKVKTIDGIASDVSYFLNHIYLIR